MKLFQKWVIIYDVNMGCVSSKRKRRLNKDIDKKKVCKVGLSLRRGNTNVEGCVKTEYYGKTKKKYSFIRNKLPTIEEKEEPVDLHETIKDD